MFGMNKEKVLHLMNTIEDGKCRRCGKKIEFLPIPEFNLEKCQCPVPILNKFTWCDTCKGYIPNADGERRMAQNIHVHRFAAIVNMIQRIDAGDY
jgi:NAD-dependent SIR2 family protein deacetylase